MIIIYNILLISVPVVYCVSSGELKTSVENDKRITINSLQDMEVLTYFLFWKHNYFHNNDYKADETQNYSKVNDSGIESKLSLIIENLKNNKLTQHLTKNSSSKKSTNNTIKSCNNIDKQLVNKWQYNMSENRIRNLCEAASGCKSVKQLIALIDLNINDSSNVKPVPLQLSQSIVRLCPLMIFQSQEHECIDRESHNKALDRPSSGAVWGYGLLFLTINTFSSLIGVSIIPLLAKSAYEVMLTLFEGLAVGALTGSAIFHLIPQAFNISDDDSDGYLWKAFIIFGGIYLFFLSERIMKIVMELRKKQKSKEHSMPSCTTPGSNGSEQTKLISHKQVFIKSHDKPKNLIRSSNTSLSETPKDSSSQKIIENEINSRLAADDGHKACDSRPDSSTFGAIARQISIWSKWKLKSQRSEIASVAWMLIFGEALINFIDGATIGAAFSQRILEGISISLTVICGELPQEFGDFAILISSGMTTRQALKYNFLSACSCYVGMIFGILLGDMTDASTYVFALAAGMFLYIALVDVTGELTAALDSASREGMRQTMKVLLLQNAGILLGICTLLLLAKYGDNISFDS